eukprot:204054-Pyramimonas_sp.AAC.2
MFFFGASCRGRPRISQARRRIILRWNRRDRKEYYINLYSSAVAMTSRADEFENWHGIMLYRCDHQEEQQHFVAPGMD